MTVEKIIFCVGTDMAEIIKYYMWGIPGAFLAAGAVRFSGRIRGRKLIWLFLLLVYLAGTAQVVFFSRAPGSRTGADLAVLSTWGAGAQAKAYVIENVLLFIPPGIFLPMIWKSMKNPLGCMTAGAACSVLVEVLQYAAQRGYCQTDDVIANTLGIFLGWSVQSAVCFIIRKRKRRAF